MKKVIISATTLYDCPLILDMQIENHKSYLTKEQQKAGYVTLLTPLHYLQSINFNKHILVARYADGELAGLPVGYLITVNTETAQANPFMKIFAAEIAEENFTNFMMIAQVGIDRRYVGKSQGIGTQLYEYLFKQVLPHTKYTHLFTEVSLENEPSCHFHKKMGFEPFKTYKDSFGNNMRIVMKYLTY